MKRNSFALVALGLALVAAFGLHAVLRVEPRLTKLERHIDVRHGQLKIDLNGPSKRYMSRQADWQITVSNPGAMPLQNVVVRDPLPPELEFVAPTKVADWSIVKWSGTWAPCSRANRRSSS